jgi:hypothetical protein
MMMYLDECVCSLTTDHGLAALTENLDGALDAVTVQLRLDIGLDVVAVSMVGEEIQKTAQTFGGLVRLPQYAEIEVKAVIVL